MAIEIGRDRTVSESGGRASYRPAVCLPVLAGAALLLAMLGMNARSASNSGVCQATASQAAIVEALAAVQKHPKETRLQLTLADDWSAAGCFDAALHVLEGIVKLAPRDSDAVARLRAAQSVVREANYSWILDQALNAAQLKRERFRCDSLEDREACERAQRLAPSMSAGATKAPADTETPASDDSKKELSEPYLHEAASINEVAAKGHDPDIERARSYGKRQALSNRFRSAPASRSSSPPHMIITNPTARTLSTAPRFTNVEAECEGH